MRIPCSASAGRRSSSCRRATGAPCARATVSRIASSVSLGAAPVLERRLDARVDLVVQAGDADHEELVEVVRVDGARTSRRSSSGTRGSSASSSTRSLNSSHESSRLKYERRVLAGPVAGDGLGRARSSRSRLLHHRSSSQVARERVATARQIEDDALAQTAAADLERPAERGRGRVEQRSAPRASAAPVRGRGREALARPRPPGSPASTCSARCSDSRVEHRADEPPQRGRAAAHRDGGVDRRQARAPRTRRGRARASRRARPARADRERR